MQTIGSRRQVWNGNAHHTTGGLVKSDLIKKNGSIKSKRASQSAKRNNNLVKAGWTTKKGEFGAVRMDDVKSKPRSNKRRSKKRSNKRRSKKR